VKLAQTGRIDLLGVPLQPVCEAYFAYLIESELSDLDEAGAALVALAYLLERKAWALLPTPEALPEIDPDWELQAATAGVFAPAVEALRVWHDSREQQFFRASDGMEYELPFELGEITASDLARAFERLMLRAVPDPIDPLGQPRRTLSEQMGIVLRALRESWQTLDELLIGEFTRSEAVWWFLALLELIRLGQARAQLLEGEAAFARRQKT